MTGASHCAGRPGQRARGGVIHVELVVRAGTAMGAGELVSRGLPRTCRRQQSKRAEYGPPAMYLVLEPRTRGDKGTRRIYSIYARQQREATAEHVSGVVRKYGVLFKVLSVPLSHKRRHQVQTENIHVLGYVSSSKTKSTYAQSLQLWNTST